jgi:uncharacterized protein YndB with AHSA1/START domain
LPSHPAATLHTCRWHRGRLRAGVLDGTEYWKQGVYREIVEPERLVFTFARADVEGKLGHETLVTVTFAEHGAKTKLTLHQAYGRGGGLLLGTYNILDLTPKGRDETGPNHNMKAAAFTRWRRARSQLRARL